MLPITVKKRYALVGALVILAVLIAGPITVYYLLMHSHTAPQAQASGQASGQASSSVKQTAGGALISRGVPAFSSPDYYPASVANDGSYDTSWRSNGTPAWLAYDLSGVPNAQRSKVLVVWYNESLNYDHTIINNYSYNMPENYTIDVNAAPGGQSAPQSGWKTVVSVQGNHYHSRQHILSMAGYNWVGIFVSKIDGAPQNFDTNINMDVYNANAVAADDWIFYGDSITALSMGHNTVGNVQSFAQLIQSNAPDHFPVEEDGGIGYLTSSNAVSYINTWLSLFPGKYVGLSYGTNDALGCVSPSTFYSNYTTLVQAVQQAGKVPVIPHIPWGRDTNIQQCAPSLNAQIDALYKNFPQIIKGPDLWTFFQHNQSLISNDNIHPTSAGIAAYRQQWANAMLAEVYNVK